MNKNMAGILSAAAVLISVLVVVAAVAARMVVPKTSLYSLW